MVAKVRNFAMDSCNIMWDNKKSKEAASSDLNSESVISETRVVKNAKE